MAFKRAPRLPVRTPRLADLMPPTAIGGSVKPPSLPKPPGYPHSNLGKYLHPKKGGL